MKRLDTTTKWLLTTCLMLVLGACAVVPKELDSQGQDDGQNFSRKVIDTTPISLRGYAGQANVLSEHESGSFYQTTFVRGDMLRFQIVGMEQYDGLYKVTTEGNLDLPFALSFPATKLTRKDLIDNIEDELVRLKWFYKESVEVNLSVVQLAPINVSVFGAVFNPGRVTINSQPITKPEEAIQQASGAFSSDRNLVSAIGAAGGVRPDADLSNVYLKRGVKVLQVTLNSLIDGDGFVDMPSLINGDQIIVQSTGFVSPSLIKPSQVTPPGMRVFMSNLTAPALSNAQSAVGADSTRLPYGSSLLDSVISANCIGGTHQANASRSVVLVTRNYGSNQQLVVLRSINQLLANSSNRSVNPFMMPNDGIACYDSRFTNFRDVARGIGEVISPILLGRLL
jgi:polysaccharide export outer membrane protein